MPPAQRTDAAQAPSPAAPRSAPAQSGGAATAQSERSADPQSTRQAGRAASARRAGRRKSRRSRLMAVGAVGVGVVAVAGTAFELMPSGGGGPVHVIATPQQIGRYVQAPALAASMSATKLRNTIVSQSNGEASHVVAAVYQDTTGAAAKNGPQIVLFIGGNLSGSSAQSFITSFIGKLPGAVTTAAGPLGGAAACVPSAAGSLAECAWADNDTFGLVTSSTLSASALADELRQVRPQVEHRAK
jgi:hypothetical protein